MYGVVAVSVLLPIIENYRASPTNLQSAHSPGTEIFNFIVERFQRDFDARGFVFIFGIFSLSSVCVKAKRFLDPSTIFHTDIDEAMQRITQTMQTLKHFRALFDKYKEKLDTYFIENQRSVGIAFRMSFCVHFVSWWF